MSDADSPRYIRSRGRDYAAAISTCDTREDAAQLYEDALRTYGLDGVDWKQINGAILARWKPSSLEWIKKRAWAGCRRTATALYAQVEGERRALVQEVARLKAQLGDRENVPKPVMDDALVMSRFLLDPNGPDVRGRYAASMKAARRILERDWGVVARNPERP